MKRALLLLEDGICFEGVSFGYEGEAIGEVVFNTGMTGYQEILTDPSYKGQLVVMTYPHVGNYGINPEDMESQGPFLEGFIVHEACRTPSNWRSALSLDEYLRENRIVGIEGVDTRALTRHIREQGAMMGILSAIDHDPKRLLQKLQDAPRLVGRDLVKEVTCDRPYVWNEPLSELQGSFQNEPRETLKVVVYDFGVKFNILRNLKSRGFSITVVPAMTPPDQVLALNPDGILLSNGPGDPAAVDYAIRHIQTLIGKKPLMGICLGHQLIGLAFGGTTYKLKFGHHGLNHPVKNLLTQAIEITSQNHGFAVDPQSLPEGEFEITHINLNDGTLEGFRHRYLPIFSVQYHPEASPGPHDSGHLFDRFRQLILEK